MAMEKKKKWLRTKERASRASIWTITTALIVYSCYSQNSAQVHAKKKNQSLAAFAGTFGQMIAMDFQQQTLGFNMLQL